MGKKSRPREQYDAERMRDWESQEREKSLWRIEIASIINAAGIESHVALAAVTNSISMANMLNFIGFSSEEANHIAAQSKALTWDEVGGYTPKGAFGKETGFSATLDKIKHSLTRPLTRNSAKKMEHQFQQSLAECCLHEQKALNELAIQKHNELQRVALMKQQTGAQLIQKEAIRLAQVKSEHLQAQDKKERLFKQSCQKVESDTQLIKAALYACMSGEAEIVRSLLGRSRTMKRAFMRLNPLHIAAECNQVEIIQLLCRHGMDLNQRNKEQATALDIAEEQGNVEAVRALTLLTRMMEQNPPSPDTVNTEVEEPLIAEKVDSNLLYHGPQWSDAYGWSTPQYYETIQSVMLSVNGENKLFALARSAAGIHCHHYDFEHKTWVEDKFGPHWSDDAGFGNKQYYSTIQMKPMMVRGQNKLYLLIRQAAGIELWSYDPYSGDWARQSDGPLWSDKTGWFAPQYYATIHTQVVKTSDNQDKLFVLARHSAGIDLWSYDPIINQWTQHPAGPHWSDKVGWNLPQYYSTIQTQVIKTQDGKNKLLVLARQSAGIELWSYDPDILQWTQHPYGPSWSDIYGWNNPCHYSTIQSQVLAVNGEEHLFCLSRDMLGIDCWSFNLNTQQWIQHHRGPQWDDQSGWLAHQYYSTIQATRMPGEGKDKTDILLLFGRSSAGIEAHAYHSVAQTWIQLPLSVPLEDKAGWFLSPYYSTMQMHFSKVSQERAIITLARAASGLQCHMHSIDDISLVEKFKQDSLIFQRIAQVENQKAMNFLNKIDIISRNLLNAAENGYLHGVQESLRLGGDITFTQTGGYDALQLAIINHADISVIKALLKAGANTHYRENVQNKNALELAASHSIEIYNTIAESQGSPLKQVNQEGDTTAQLRERYQHHWNKAQRFLERYPDDLSKCKAMLAYYRLVSKVDPKAVYAWPAMFILGEILTVAEHTPSEALQALPREVLFLRAQRFFKRNFAVHHALNDVGVEHYAILAQESEWSDLDWSHVIASITLMQIDQNPAQSPLLHQAMKSYLTGFAIQVLGLNFEQLAWVEPATQWLMEQQTVSQDLFREYFKQAVRTQAENVGSIAKDVNDSELMLLPAKSTLKEGVTDWKEGHQYIQEKLRNVEMSLANEKQALLDWLATKESEYLNYTTEIGKWVQATQQETLMVESQMNEAKAKIKQHFSEIRRELLIDEIKAKRKLTDSTFKGLVGIAVGACLAPMIASTFASSLSATSLAVTKGTILGGVSSGIAGNNPIKGMIQGGLFAGFGCQMSGLLEKSVELQLVRSAILAAGTATLHTALNGGNLGKNLLTSVGSTVLGDSLIPEAKGVESFSAQMRDAVLKGFITGGLTSVITGTNLGQNLLAAGIGAATHTIAERQGETLANSLWQPTQIIQPELQEEVSSDSSYLNPPEVEKTLMPIIREQGLPIHIASGNELEDSSTQECPSLLTMAKRAWNGGSTPEEQQRNRECYPILAAISDGFHESSEWLDKPLRYKKEILENIDESVESLNKTAQDTSLDEIQRKMIQMKIKGCEATAHIADTLLPSSMGEVGVMVGTYGAVVGLGTKIAPAAKPILNYYKKFLKKETPTEFIPSLAENEFYKKAQLICKSNYQNKWILPDKYAKTFSGHTYSTYRLKEETVLYRCGTESKPFGQYYAFEETNSIMQARIDKAMPLSWSNSKIPDPNKWSQIDTCFAVKVPKGTIVHVGKVADQGGIYVGGTTQIVIEKSQLSGAELELSFPLSKINKLVK